jgi:hypothetical protein
VEDFLSISPEFLNSRISFDSLEKLCIAFSVS